MHKIIVIGTLVLALVFSSCYNSSREKGSWFHYNESSGIASLDPAFARNQSIMWAVHQLYNTLVEVDSNLHPAPSLAYRWEIAPDRKTYTFHLRRDVFFHDDPCFPGGRGRKLVAQDVVYSLSRILDARTASPGSWIFNGRVDSLQPFLAPDDSTFQLRLRQPYPPILGILTMQYCSIVPHEAVEKWGADFRRHPVGSGPFRFTAWEEGLALILKKNPAYFEQDGAGRRLPYLDGIKVSFSDSKATEFLLFRQEKLDFINDIDPSFKDEVLTKRGTLRPEWQQKIRLQTHPYLNVEYFGLLVDPGNPLVKAAPTRFQKVRQAINYGFDRKKMILYLRNSLGIPALSGFVPAGLPSFNPLAVQGYDYDPDRARRLLAEAGYSEQNPPVVKLLTIPIYAGMADFIARQLEDVGIVLQVEVVQKALLLDLTAHARALFFRASWIADYPDAENFLSVFYSKNPAPPNYTRYKNPKFDALFEKALTETDDSARFRLYQLADEVVMKDAPVVPLWYDVVVRLVQPGIEGFAPNALNLLELRRCWKKS